MKIIRSVYHFLGGILFALILIGSVALFVIAGTFIESVTQSHRYAALFTYNNPIFALLLWGFFINILFSATRRLPFRGKHIPFLTTHLGLLMMISGVLFKHYYGIQGTMSLMEGTASHEIMEMNTYAIQLSNKNSGQAQLYPLHINLGGNFRNEVAKTEDMLSIRLAEFQPHCKEHLAGWVKGNHAFIMGLKPMPLYVVNFEEDKLPSAARTKFHKIETEQTLSSSNDTNIDNHVWDLYALRTTDLEKTLSKLYVQNAHIKTTDRITKQIIGNYPLESLLNSSLNSPLNTSSKAVSAKLNLTSPLTNDLSSPEISFKFPEQTQLTIPLAGEKALLNLHADPQLGNLTLAVDILQQPHLAIIEDDAGDVLLYASDAYGKIWTKSFKKGNLDLLVSYDDGFAGYTSQVTMPFKSYPAGREEREDALAGQLLHQLRHAATENAPLAPPLQLLFNACKKTQTDFDFAATNFLCLWNCSNEWLFQEHTPLPPELSKVLASVDWNEVSPQIKQGCEWTVNLFKQINPDLKQEQGNLIAALRKNRWPLLSALENEATLNNESRANFEYQLLTHQLFSASELMPSAAKRSSEINNAKPEEQASLISAYLRAYGIHLGSILPVPSEEEMNELIHQQQVAKFPQADPTDASPEFQDILLETQLIPVQKTLVATCQLEENQPKITLFINKGSRKQSLSLAYERSGKGLKWPILDGEYLVRFQPMFKEIPYRLRLRQARQINYANTSQPYSFESDLIIKDARTGEISEKTISMNKVHETWDGYRFYLSSIAPADETSTKQVQIVVNYDPAKYLLTYPGAIVLSCGILMLFIMRPYRRSKP